MSRKSPKKMKTDERVFKTPMTFSPHIGATPVRPSPSRIELWREELGLADDSMCMGSNNMSSDSGSDGEMDLHKGHTLIELQTLQKELDERNSQRDELLFNVKTLQEKMKHYKSRLVKEEMCKQQQFKILRKTHEAHLQDKQHLIKNLEDVIEEQEANIMQLDAQCKGNLPLMPIGDEPRISSTQALVEQILKLQREKSDMHLEILNSQEDAHQDKMADLIATNDKLEKEKQQLQEEVIKLWSKKGNGDTDTEKQLCKKEIENDELQEELRQIQTQANKLQDQVQAVTEGKELSEEQSQRLAEDNTRLHDRLDVVTAELRQHEIQKAAALAKYQEDLLRLRAENDKLSLEIKEIQHRLTIEQDKPPEIRVHVEHVEVESTKCREDLSHCQGLLEGREKELIALKEETLSWQQKFQDVTRELLATNEMVTSLGTVQSEKESLATEITKITMICNQLDKELTLERGRVQDLELQLNQYQSELSKLRLQMAEEVQVLQEVKNAELRSMQEQFEVTSSDQREKLKMLRTNLSETHRVLMTVVQEYQKLKELCWQFPQLGQIVVQQISAQVSQAIQGVSEYNTELVRKYRKEMALRKKYHNELVELKGNIRVFCRVRPLIKEDGAGSQADCVVSYDTDDDAVLTVLHRGRQQNFDMDRVFRGDSTQEEVFCEVQSLVTSCIDGYNVCIFAYGQTGSGKTYTMEGVTHCPGINQRALQELFRETADRSQEWNFSITVSTLEIYNEMIRDLLSDDPQNKLEVKMAPEGGLYVPGLQSYTVESVEDVNQVFTLGQENRATATTNMNEHSSRSHALLCVNVVGENTTTGARTAGKLNLVDLAGSERVSKSGAEGARLKEAQNINKSLSTLGDVIHALRCKQGHIPYRNSKLTYLLQDSLGGDSKTLMIVQVAPVEKNVAETVASLAFAQRVRSVELGQATRRLDNMDHSPLEDPDQVDVKENGFASGFKTPLRQVSTSGKVNRSNRK